MTAAPLLDTLKNINIKADEVNGQSTLDGVISGYSLRRAECSYDFGEGSGISLRNLISATQNYVSILFFTASNFST